MATMLVGRHLPEDALTWIDRGLALDGRRGGSGAEIRLAELRGRVLKKLRREEEALEAVWARYLEHPSRHGRQGPGPLLRAIANALDKLVTDGIVSQTSA